MSTPHTPAERVIDRMFGPFRSRGTLKDIRITFTQWHRWSPTKIEPLVVTPISAYDEKGNLLCHWESAGDGSFKPDRPFTLAPGEALYVMPSKGPSQ